MGAYLGFILILVGTLFVLHYIRLKKSLNLFLFYTGLLWVTSYILGHLNLSVPLTLGEGSVLHLRYSSSVFTIIFAAVLLGYLSGGVREARSVIWACIISQLFLMFLMLMHQTFWVEQYASNMRVGAEILLEPAYGKMVISIVAAVLDMFAAILIFQFFTNKISKMPRWLLVFIAIEGAMILDSFIFVGITRPETFFSSMYSHLILKTLIGILVTLPLTVYLHFLQKRSHLNFHRGTLDIFSQIEDLQEDLEKANAELREYARTLEEKVEERTKEIIKKQKQIEFELNLATEVQATMLPSPDQLPDVPISAIYLPVSKVSGDLYQFRYIFDDEFFVFLADISGHGVPAALIGTITAMTIEKLRLRTKTPAEILKLLSDEVRGLESTHYFTGIFMTVNRSHSKIYYCNAAHPPALLMEPDGELIEIAPTGSVLGTSVDIELAEERVKYSPGAFLLLYSDCVTEHSDPDGNEYGIERLKEFLLTWRGKPVDGFAEALVDDLKSFSHGKEFNDDLTALLLKL